MSTTTPLLPEDSPSESASDRTALLVHTVKNNLQVLSSLCSLYSRSITDPEALSAFSRIRGSVMVFADAYECLYRTGCTDTIPVRSYLQKVVPHVSSIHKGGDVGLTVTCSFEDSVVPFSTAIPWALFLNEIFADLVEVLSQAHQTVDVTVTGAVQDSSLSITLRVTSSSATGEPLLKVDKALTETVGHGKVGEALIRQSDGVIRWISDQPPELNIIFPIS